MTSDLVLVSQAFWAIRGRYDGGKPIPMDGFRDGLSVLGLADDADWILPLLIGMDEEFSAFVRERSKG